MILSITISFSTLSSCKNRYFTYCDTMNWPFWTTTKNSKIGKVWYLVEIVGKRVANSFTQFFYSKKVNFFTFNIFYRIPYYPLAIITSYISLYLLKIKWKKFTIKRATILYWLIDLPSKNNKMTKENGHECVFPARGYHICLHSKEGGDFPNLCTIWINRFA